MSAQHLEVIETTVQKTHQWIDALADLSHMDTHSAYQVLRAVLHTLRDRLPPAEVAQLAAQLPLLLRGIFYEGWRPSDSPSGLSYEQFLTRVQDRIVSSRIIDPKLATQQTLQVMADILGYSELEKLACVFPKEILTLFPKRPAATL